MRENKTYNPCDDCQYSFSKTGQENNECKICEFTYFRDLAHKATAESATLNKEVDELNAHVYDLRNRCHLIWALGHDYDGCNTVKSLKELIDELVSYTQLPSDKVPKVL